MHVLITGGAGFIGSHLVEYHLQRGDHVHVVDDLSTGSLVNLSPFRDDPHLRFDRADLLTWDELEKATAWADRVYHLAAVVGMFRVLEDPIRVLAVNIAGTERLLRAAAAGGWKPHILIASTSEVYGPDKTEPLREDMSLCVPDNRSGRWNYAISKLADEAMATSYARGHDLPITIARLFNTTGPRQSGRYGMVVPRFVAQAVLNEPITVFGDGSQRRCFCDVRDTVRALDGLLEREESRGQIFNVGNDRECSIEQLAAWTRRRAGSESRIEYMSYEEAYGEPFRDIARRRPVLDKLRSMTGFEHRYTLEDTLDDLIREHDRRMPVRSTA